MQLETNPLGSGTAPAASTPVAVSPPREGQHKPHKDDPFAIRGAHPLQHLSQTELMELLYICRIRRAQLQRIAADRTQPGCIPYKWFPPLSDSRGWQLNLELLLPTRVQHVYNYTHLAYDMPHVETLRLARALGIKGVTVDTFHEKARFLVASRLARQGRLLARTAKKTAVSLTWLFGLELEQMRQLCRELGQRDRVIERGDYVQLLQRAMLKLLGTCRLTLDIRESYSYKEVADMSDEAVVALATAMAINMERATVEKARTLRDIVCFTLARWGRLTADTSAPDVEVS